MQCHSPRFLKDNIKDNIMNDTTVCKIRVATRLQDNQDGGYTMYVYNDKEELLKNHPMAKDGELSDEQREEILNEEDPYENGYIESDVIEIEVFGNIPLKPLRLAKPMVFHAGQ